MYLNNVGGRYRPVNADLPYIGMGSKLKSL